MRRLLAAALCLAAGAALAQGYPSKPLRLIVSFPPGGSSDFVARAVAAKISDRLGQQVLVENRGGAGGNIGVDAVAKAAPDGYTLGVAAAGALSVNATLYPSMPFDADKDLAPVSLMAMIPFVLISGAQSPFMDLKDVIAAARAGNVAYAHGGNGSAMHLCGELLKMMAGIELQAVPYKGSGPVASDVLGGQVPLGIVDVPSALAQVKAGRLRALAVTTRRRIAAAPEVPTFDEAGVPGYEAIGWFGMIAPAGVPDAVLARINSEVRQALVAPDLRERALAAGAEPSPSTPGEFAAFIRSEREKWARVVRAAKVRID
ncbi:MAG: tripartite tricarboxylate transporter substrate binding protein [Betaproteobacteria bacterium]|nr:tripartite tricarboxylate transporter substrate binding protein [Betaproteobacteria bacterium]